MGDTQWLIPKSVTLDPRNILANRQITDCGTHTMTSKSQGRRSRKNDKCERCCGKDWECLPGSDDGSCEACEEGGLECIQPNRRPAARKRPKTEDNITDDEGYPANRTMSSVTVTSKRNDITAEDQTSRVARPIRGHRMKPSPTPELPPKKKKSGPATCDLCETDKALRLESRNTAMLACQIESCGKWWHHWCLMTLQYADDAITPDFTIFSPQVGNRENENLIFICPDCSRSERGYANQAAEAMSTFLDTMRRLRREAVNAEIPETPNPMLSSSAMESGQAQISENIPRWQDAATTPFEPARNEKFQGFDKAEVTNLMRNLTQSIFDYDLEICDILERFAKGVGYITMPLGSWDVIDTCSTMVPGRTWYLPDDANDLTRRHAPITNALRDILGTPRDMPLKIDRSYESIPFSKVHSTLIWSFVMDILLNKIEIYELPNMKPMRIMMWAVHSFADERWPGKGMEALQEVELRTWSRPQFQAELQQNKAFITRKFDDFLEPLTKGFSNKYSHHKDDLINTMIKLWSYFQSLRGTWVEIKPELGSKFDPSKFEIRDDDGTTNLDNKYSVAWVVRRGFEYHGIDGALIATQKAVVVLDRQD
ncbi:hypothetical protein BKA65DRAFT_594805 [Rhexocercosporidium sp. MPI-PUGE-AT-0058]|nr:hypothetical protein BKA65DRAFT_594805 [Rhexocercosporidium sp. MPI-PUGE-AT-0058]